jgi:RNA polymerase sigma-70 factor (ECF subfamily)
MQRTNNTSQWNETEIRLRSLLLAGKAGDDQHYLTFLKEIGVHLRGYFRKRLTYLPDDVEDLVQETLLAVHNQRHTYDEYQPLTAWVHAIAKYKLVDLFRARAAKDALTDTLDDECDLFAVSDAEATEAHLDIEGLLAKLPDRHRLPIFHMKLQGLSVQETARLTGMSESAVKVGVHRGLKALAVMIGGNREN